MQTTSLGELTPEIADATQLTRVQGALLMQYLDAQDLICDAVIEEPLVVAIKGQASATSITEGEHPSAASLAREGRSARRTGDLATARRLLEAALVTNPRDAGALTSLGRVAAEAGSRTEAEALFRRALAFEPNNAYAMVNLATLLIDRREFDQARELVERAVRVDPALAQAREMAARLKSVGATARATDESGSTETAHDVE